MIYVTVLLACAAGVLGAAFAVAWSALRRTRRSAEGYAAEVNRLAAENSTLSATLAVKNEATEARLQDKDRACEERLAELKHTLEETVARLRSEFSALAADKLEEKSNVLSERNARDVKPLFDALRQNIDEFRKAAESTRESNVKLGGDLTDRGMIRTMELYKKAWDEVFKGDRQTVHLYVTGNHDVEDGFRYWAKGIVHSEDPKAIDKVRLGPNLNAAMERIWGEPYEDVWHKTVNGYHFFGMGWGLNPDDQSPIYRGRLYHDSPMEGRSCSSFIHKGLWMSELVGAVFPSIECPSLATRGKTIAVKFSVRSGLSRKMK